MLIKSQFLYGEDFELKKGTLVVEDGIIKGFTNEHSKDVINFNGLVIPPLINAHTHIADNCIKDIGINKTLDELVKPPNGLKHRYLSKVSREILIESIKLGLDDLKNNGIRYFCDFRENGIEGVKILKTSLKDYNYPKAKILGRPTKINKVDKNEVKEILKISDGLGLSGANEFEDYDLKAIYKVYKDFEDKLFAIHACEHRGSVEYSLKKYGQTEVERLINLNVYPDFIVHGTYLTDSEIDILKENNIPVVVCVRANLSFNVGYPQLNKLIDNGLLIGIGTDNFMANSPSIFREMEFIYKLYHIDPKEILKMATINNAKILKLENVGLIEEGFKGVFTFIKPTNAILFSKNIVASVVTRCEKSDIINFLL